MKAIFAAGLFLGLNNFNLKKRLHATMHADLYQRIILLCFVLYTPFWAFSQVESVKPNNTDSTIRDSIETVGAEEVEKDTIIFSTADHKSSLETPVEYGADDSIILNLEEKKAYLFGKAWIIYDDVKLNAEYIEVDFDNKDLFARGIINDTTGKYAGRPVFSDNGKEYEADTMLYNFESKKGLSMGVLTTEKDGYIHGEKVLRDSLENIFVKNAKFTTCNLEHPHFYIKADKIKVIPKKQIVTGPANLVIGDVRTPLFVPFGFFPIPEKQAHGVLFPSFGESPDRGFFFRGLGYYVPINDHFDVQASGDFYFRGSWGMAVKSNYYKRYRYRGNLSFTYNKNFTGEKESPSFNVSNDYRVTWNFNRDSKAKPGSNFSANVNFVTSNFLKNNTSNYNDIISTTSTSSVSYGRSLLNNKLNLSVNSNIYQDLSTGVMNFTLPQVTANVSRQMPFSDFKSKNKTLQSFARNMGISYAGTFKNEIETKDSFLLSGIGEMFSSGSNANLEKLQAGFNNGISHRIPIATSFKALKWITVSPNFSFSEYWYFKTVEKEWNPVDSQVVVRDVQGFSRGYNYQTSIGLSTILYSMFQFQKSKVMAIRHVMRPNISAVWNPDFGSGFDNGYRTVQTDTAGTISTYSIYENGIIGRPTGGAQGSLNFGMGNNIEVKLRGMKDTANGGIKKVKIIESLNINSGYNFLADSFHLNNISLNGNTTILNMLRINFRTTIDPYDYDSTGGTVRRVDEFLFNNENKFGNVTSTSISFSTNLNPQAFKKKTTSNVDDQELEFINNNLQDYVDFNIPWSLNFNYNFNANSPVLKESTISQSVTFNGDVKITDNWKIGLSSGYDITREELSFTSIEFFRNLHCWEMNFKWYPIQRQMFEFSIRVKSSTLQDLKLNRRRSWWDY